MHWQSLVGILRSLAIYWRPGRQPALRRLYRPFLPPGALVFDVGAHLGDRTRAFAHLGARVVALEPQAELFRWLRLLVGSQARVTLRREAVGQQPGEAVLAVSRRTPTVSTLSRDWPAELGCRNASFRDVSWEESVRVPVITLDQLIEEYGVPDFCKIDVEGFEAEVLAGLSQPVPALSFEFVAGVLDIALASVRRLEKLGRYEYNAIAGEQRSFLFPAWQSAVEIGAWLDAGAGGLPSGDVYARMLSVRIGDAPGHGPARPDPSGA
jgi:FkbM family methyltransferase